MKKIFILSTLIALVIVLAAVGIILWKNRGLTQPGTVNINNANAAPVPQGPQTFTDTNFNFSVTVPDKWSFKRLNTQKTVFYPTKRASELDQNGYFGDIIIRVVLQGVKEKTSTENSTTLPLDETHVVIITAQNPERIGDGIYQNFVNSFKKVAP